MLHILDRFFVHLFSASGAVLLAVHTLRWVARRTGSTWIPLSLRDQLTLCSLVVVALTAIWESVHVAQGQPVVKAFTDFISWVAGSAAAVYALYRLRGARWS